MSLNFFAQTEQETSQASYRRLSRASYRPASSTVMKTTAPSSKKEQRSKSCKDSKLLLTAASPAALFFGSSERRNLLVGGEALEEGGAEGLWGAFATPTGRDAGHLASPIFVAVRPMTTWAIHGPVCQFAEQVHPSLGFCSDTPDRVQALWDLLTAGELLAQLGHIIRIMSQMMEEVGYLAELLSRGHR